MSVLNRIRRRVMRSVRGEERLEDLAFLVGQQAAFQLRGMHRINRLSDVEFRVSSQWGEDGIIEWLVDAVGDLPGSFVEFGVENYCESNTRFLLQNRGWRGLVIDGSQQHIDYIKQDRISWRHDLTAVASFITRENINSIIKGSGVSGEIGILSVDIDGVDYWVWEAITCVSPVIIIAEYNSAFGDVHPLSVPYSADFVRRQAHSSNLYYGMAIGAARHLATARGYVFVGTNRAGSNAFFVRNDKAANVLGRIGVVDDRPSLFKEARNAEGNLTFPAAIDRASLIAEMPVVDVINGVQVPLRQFSEIYSERWRAFLSHGYQNN